MSASESTVGTRLATQAADTLETGAVLADSHRDYCGTGLRFADGEYIYGQVYDGRFPTNSEAPTWLEAWDVERKVFPQRHEFIAWLGVQSDDSLSGKTLPESWQRNAGRLTIERLRPFVGEGD